jgi:hypothetical protein
MSPEEEIDEPSARDGDRRGGRVERHAGESASAQSVGSDDSERGDKSGEPRAEDDHGGDVDARGECEGRRLPRIERGLVRQDLDQLHQENGRPEQGERRDRHRVHVERRDRDRRGADG